MRLYLIGSLRNPQIPSIARALRESGHQVVDDWYAAGETADESWQRYEIQRGRTYSEALDGLAARHVFDFDYGQIIQSDAAVLVAPAGKSAHLELGYFLGQGKPGHILLEPDTERWDVMLRFATGVHSNLEDLIEGLRGMQTPNGPLNSGEMVPELPTSSANSTDLAVEQAQPSGCKCGYRAVAAGQSRTASLVQAPQQGVSTGSVPDVGGSQGNAEDLPRVSYGDDRRPHRSPQGCECVWTSRSVESSVPDAAREPAEEQSVRGLAPIEIEGERWMIGR